MATPLYRQNRGSNGRFGSGYTANTVAGGRSPLFYYDSGETRRVTDNRGRTNEPGGRRTTSAGERAINNAIRTAGMRGANRNPAMRTRSRNLR